MSPVKCLPVDYGMTSHMSTGLSSGIDAFSFEPGANNTTNCPAQPKPRKFFKSRATEDVTKTTTNVQNPSLLSNCVDYPLNHGEILSGANLYPAVSGGVGYLSPTYTSPTSKVTTKRGRGRPKGTRTASPRGSSTTTSYKPNAARGATPRGRRRVKSNRSVRGQQSGGRGKRKRAKWEGESESEEEEEEEEAVSSELEEPVASAKEAEPDEEEEEENQEYRDENQEDEEENQEDEELESKNGLDCLDNSREECKPPIKLRIIRRNDTNAFVSKVGTEPDNVTSDFVTPPVTDLPKQEFSKSLECTNKFDVTIHPENERALSPEVPIKKESPEHYPVMEVSVSKNNCDVVVVCSSKYICIYFF